MILHNAYVEIMTHCVAIISKGNAQLEQLRLLGLTWLKIGMPNHGWQTKVKQRAARRPLDHGGGGVLWK